ncbi:MAG: cysteine desulfurase [Treponema sp.]|nr:cysteine desulfurase [Treponema sp.]MCL2250932.1 cysteine desulfurase [Treponema sp.]
MSDSKEKRIYFDWAASSPYFEQANSALFGNPSSQHSEGKAAKQAIDEARRICSQALEVPAETLFFTSGGTESNSIALFSNLMRKGQGRILCSMAEHASIRSAMETLDKLGKPTGSIAVDSSGRVTENTLKKALQKFPDTRFVSIMAVNNETGTITDMQMIRDTLRQTTDNKAPIHFHCDLVQAIGKIPIDLKNWEIDSASVSAHKIGGPRGIGLLYLRKPIEVFYSGGGQENGIRGGTENTQGAAALSNCFSELGMMTDNRKKLFSDTLNSAKKRWEKLISSLYAMERCTLIPADRKPDDERFSPYILQAAFHGIPGEVMARALDDLGIAVSTGSACSSSSPERPVLTAMGVEENLRIEGIRISQGSLTSDEEIDLLLDAISQILKFL